MDKLKNTLCSPYGACGIREIRASKPGITLEFHTGYESNHTYFEFLSRTEVNISLICLQE